MKTVRQLGISLIFEYMTLPISRQSSWNQLDQSSVEVKRARNQLPRQLAIISPVNQ